MPANTATLQLRIKVSDDGTVKVLDRVGSASRKAGDTGVKSFARMESSAKSMTASLLKAGAAIGGLYAIKRAGVEIFDVGKKMAASRKAMELITGSTHAAAEEFAFLQEKSDALGQNFYALIDPYKQLIAASRGTALEGQKTRDIFEGIVKAGAALGMTTDDVKGSLKALDQMISKGNVQAEELRGQLGERLPGAFQLAARAMDVSTEKLNDMLERGDILADDLLPKLAAQLNKEYSGEVANAVRASNKLSESWTRIKVTLGDAGIVETVAHYMLAAAEGMDAWGKANDEFLKQKIPAYIDGIFDSMSRLYSLYQLIPSDIVGAAGYGIVGRILFGGWGPAKFAAAFSIINNGLQAIEKLTVGQARGLGESWKGYLEAYDNIIAVLSGQKDMSTGKVIDEDIQKLHQLENYLNDIKNKGSWWLPADETEIKRVEQEIENLKWKMRQAFEEPPDPGFFETIGEEIDLTAESTAQVTAELKTLETKVSDIKKAGPVITPDDFKDAARYIEDTLTPLERYVRELDRITDLTDKGLLDGDQQARAIQRAGQAYVDALGDTTTEYKKWWDELDETTKNAIQAIQSHVAGFLSDMFRGEFDSSEQLFEGFLYSLSDIVAEDMSKSLMDMFEGFDWDDALKGLNDAVGDTGLKFGDDLKDVVGGLIGFAATLYSASSMSKEAAAFSGAISGAQVGASASGNSPYAIAAGAIIGGGSGYLAGQDTPSFGEQFSKALDSVVNELKMNTDAIRLNTEQRLHGKGYTAGELTQEYLTPNFLLKEILDNRSIAESLALPNLFSRSDIIDLYGEALKDQRIKWGTTKASPEELDSIFTALFDSFEKGKVPLTEIYDIFSSLAEGDIDPLLDALKELPEAFSPEEYIDAMMKAGFTRAEAEKMVNSFWQVVSDTLESGSTQQANIRAGKAGLGIFDEMFATIESEATEYALNIDSLLSGMFEQYDIDQPTAYQAALSSVNDTFGELETQAADILALYDAGLIDDLDPQVVETLRGLPGALDELEVGIREFYRRIRSDILGDMRQELLIAQGAISGMDQTYMRIEQQADDYEQALIDAGNTTENAAYQTNLWTQAMKDAALAAQLATDRNSYNLQILRALGDEEGAISLQRQMETDAINDLYGAGTDAANEILGLAQALWDLEDAARAAAAVDAARSVYRNAVQGHIDDLTSQRQQVESEFETAKNDYINALNEKIAEEDAATQRRISGLQASANAAAQMASEAQRLADTFDGLADRIADFRRDLLADDIMISRDAKYATAQRDLASAVSGMYSGNASKQAAALEKIPDLAQSLLSASMGMGGIDRYQADLAHVLTVLNTAEGMAVVGESNAEKQLASALARQRAAESAADSLKSHTSKWERMLAEVNGQGEDNRSFDDIQAEYLRAEAAYNDTALTTEIDYWQQELDRLDAIIAGDQSLETAFINYSEALTAAIAGGYADLENNFAAELDALEAPAIAGGEAQASFSGGGTISGPASGYNVMTQFHGTEHITPDSQMAAVKETLRDVREVLIEIRNTGGDANLTGKKMFRILDRVTQGGTTVRTEAA